MNSHREESDYRDWDIENDENKMEEEEDCVLSTICESPTDKNDVKKSNMYLTRQRYLDEFGDKPLIFVDIQFIDKQVSEIAIIRPDATTIYHRFYNVLMNKNMNRRTVNHNIRYTGYVSGSAIYNIFNDSDFFSTLPNDAIYVIRGLYKYRYLRNLLQTFGKKYTIFTFPEQFNRHFQCPLHIIPSSMCAVYNVISMSKYYDMYTNLSYL